MLGKRLEHKIETEEKCESQVWKKQEVTNSDCEDKGEEGKCSHVNEELVITQAPQGDTSNLRSSLFLETLRCVLEQLLYYG